jgi:hypothetical protein
MMTQAQSQAGGVAQLSRYCFNNLFDLCKFKEDDHMYCFDPEEESKVRRGSDTSQRIARIATPILINRCRQTLRKFVTDEIKVGSLSMPRNRINEAVFILDRLKTLDCFP